MTPAFFGLFAGLWKLALIAAGLALLVWRKGLFRHPLVRLLLPVVRRRVEVQAAEPPQPRRGFWARVVSDRWYLALLIVALSTIVIWALARYSIHTSVSPGD